MLLRTICLSALLMMLAGCGSFTAFLTGGVASDFSTAVTDSDDPDTVRQALPAYLLMIDALLKDSNSPRLYWSGAKLNASYAGQFAENPQQKKRLATKAWVYAQLAACYENDRWCGVAAWPQTELQTRLQDTDENDVALLFNLASAWAVWLEANSSDWNAVAQLGKIELLMQHVVVLDESYELGSAHLYLGVLATLIPAALGGKPEVGKAHFERAILLSEGNNLMAKVLYAERYARSTFDRDLHDRLLSEVLAANKKIPGWTLANTLAQQKAQQLLSNGDDFF